MTDTYAVTAAELRQFFERYEQLDAEKRDIADQQKEVVAELVARVRAATRRAQMRGEAVADPIVTTSAFEIDRSSAKVTRGSEQVRLTPTEWHILDVLAANYGKLVTQRQLLADVWGPGYEGQGHYLRVHMAALRRKLEPEPGRPVHLLTEPGLGYRLV